MEESINITSHSKNKKEVPLSYFSGTSITNYLFILFREPGGNCSLSDY